MARWLDTWHLHPTVYTQSASINKNYFVGLQIHHDYYYFQIETIGPFLLFSMFSINDNAMNSETIGSKIYENSEYLTIVWFVISFINMAHSILGTIQI